ncbi:MAG: hypothetical protein CMH55_04750 [Myxococcales bacterium]|nr:hypothetical protein [Myxococcales bacterium]
MRLLATALLALAGSGCVLHGPRPIPPVADLKAPAIGPSKSLQPVAWWESLGDPKLNSTVKAVLATNLDLHAIDQQLNQQRALVRLRRAGMLPQVNLAVNGNFQPGQVMEFNLPPIPGFEPPAQPEDPYAVSLTSQFSLAYEADLFGRLRHGKAAAEADLMAAQADRQTTALLLAGRTVELYLAAIEARAQLKQLEVSLELQEKQLALLQNRHQKGLGDLLAVHQQEQLIATTHAQVPLLKNRLASAALQLAALQGETRTVPGALGLRLDFPVPEALPADGLSAELILRRPDVAAAVSRLRSADHRLGEALVARYPSLRIQANAGLGIAPNSPTGVELADLGEAIGDDLRNIFDNPGEQMAWNIGGALSVPLFSGGRVKAQIETAQAGYRALALRYRKTVVEAVVEMSNAMAAENSQRAYIKRLEAQAKAVRATRDLALARYGDGLIGYQSYLQAELSLNQVTRSLISARRQLVSHRVTLMRAIAGPVSSPKGGRQ